MDRAHEAATGAGLAACGPDGEECACFCSAAFCPRGGGLCDASVFGLRRMCCAANLGMGPAKLEGRNQEELDVLCRRVKTRA